MKTAPLFGTGDGLVASDSAEQSSGLVGGVMTPPYRRRITRKKMIDFLAWGCYNDSDTEEYSSWSKRRDSKSRRARKRCKGSNPFSSAKRPGSFAKSCRVFCSLHPSLFTILFSLKMIKIPGPIRIPGNLRLGRRILLLQGLLNSNSHGDGHADHGVDVTQ